MSIKKQVYVKTQVARKEWYHILEIMFQDFHKILKLILQNNLETFPEAVFYDLIVS